MPENDTIWELDCACPVHPGYMVNSPARSHRPCTVPLRAAINPPVRRELKTSVVVGRIRITAVPSYENPPGYLDQAIKPGNYRRHNTSRAGTPGTTTLQNQTRATTFLVQLVQRLRLLVFDFGVYCLLREPGVDRPAPASSCEAPLRPP
eukprot:974438-Rhodomonas_salina.2